MRGYHAHNVLHVLADSHILLAVSSKRDNYVGKHNNDIYLVVLVLDRIPVCGQ